MIQAFIKQFQIHFFYLAPEKSFEVGRRNTISLILQRMKAQII